MSVKQKHLDLNSRLVIEHSLDSSLSFKAIARELQKDCTTISKEVRNHLLFKKTGSFGKPFSNCALRFGCDFFPAPPAQKKPAGSLDSVVSPLLLKGQSPKLLK